MTFRNFIMRGILPIIGIALLLYVGKHIYMVDGAIDWFRLCLVVGIPIGLPHMFIVFPIHGETSSTVGMIVMCLIIGAVFGSVIAVYIVIRAVVYIVAYPLATLIRAISKRKHTVYTIV